jgi:lipopolysaccharide biosynthesis glycosyltransferase
MPIPILFAIDDNYLRQIQVTILSLYQHAHASTCYHVYILNHQLSQPTRDALSAFVHQHHERGGITFLDIASVLHEQIPKVGSWGASASFRLFAPQMLPHLDKAIYLDADILVLDDLSPLYSVELAEYALAGVAESDLPYRGAMLIDKIAAIDGKEDIKYQYDWLYINSGSLLLNLKVLRGIHLEDIALRLLQGMPPNGIWLEDFVPKNVEPRIFPDQDILYYISYAYTAGIVYLPIRYNYLVFLFDKVDEPCGGYEHYVNFCQQEAVTVVSDSQEPAIVHFATMHPWCAEHSRVRYADKYHELATQIGWQTRHGTLAYFIAKVRRYIKHRLVLPQAKHQLQRLCRRY